AVGEVGLDARRQVAQHVDQRAPRSEARGGIVAYLVGDLRRIQVEGELDGQCAAGPRGAGVLPRGPRRSAAVQLGRRRIYFDDRVAGDGQDPVRLGDVEI